MVGASPGGRFFGRAVLPGGGIRVVALRIVAAVAVAKIGFFVWHAGFPVEVVGGLLITGAKAASS